MRYLASVEHELFWAGSTVKTACRQIRYAPEFKPPVAWRHLRGAATTINQLRTAHIGQNP